MQLCRPYLYVIFALCVPVLVALDVFTRVDILAEAWWPNLMELAKYVPLLALLFWIEHRQARVPFWLPVAKTLVEAVVLLHVAAVVLRLMDHATSTLVMPLVDVQLAAMDEALGLSWIGYFQWIHQYPTWHSMLSWSYGAIEIAMLAIVAGLLVLRQSVRARAMVEAIVICAVISIAFGVLFPARGAAHFWVADFAAFPNYPFPPGMYAVEIFDGLRNMYGPVVIGDTPLVGLVTFPSVHMATGVLFLLATMRTWLWLPGWVFSGLMIAATPIWGGHYFIDLIGGGALALVVWHYVMRSLSPAAATGRVQDPALASGAIAAE